MTTVKKEKEAVHAKASRYFEGVGRRKTATARVRISKGDGEVVVNGKPVAEYFRAGRLAQIATQPVSALQLDKLSISVQVSGGGLPAQAEAVRHGLARAIIVSDPETKARLRALGFMTRDPRMVERKHYGLKKARRAPQWAKR